MRVVLQQASCYATADESLLDGPTHASSWRSPDDAPAPLGAARALTGFVPTAVEDLPGPGSRWPLPFLRWEQRHGENHTSRVLEREMTSHSKGTDPAQPLIARRAQIEASMALYLTGPIGDEPSREDNDAAHRLVETLITSLREPEASATAFAGQPVARHYYSRFGDGLAPILRDVLGSDADAGLLASAIDGYWRAVRSQLQ